MTAVALAAQVLLPLMLIAWVAFLPSGSLIGFMAQAAGTGAVLFASSLVAQWAVPVWWLPRVYGCLWLAALVGRLLHMVGLSLLPVRLSGWLALALSLMSLPTGLGGEHAYLQVDAAGACAKAACVDAAGELQLFAVNGSMIWKTSVIFDTGIPLNSLCLVMSSSLSAR